MDHGKLTDHNGKQVDFRNVILIMTTNAGAADLARQAYGFTRIKRDGDDVEAINRMFAPEFRNRLDAIITFAHLTPEIIAKVVEKFVLQLEAQLGDRDVTIELSEEAAKWLIMHGYDEQMGARPMARLIQEHIKKPLADEVLFGKLKAGGHVRVIVTRDEPGKDDAKDRPGTSEAIDEQVRAIEAIEGNVIEGEAIEVDSGKADETEGAKDAGKKVEAVAAKPEAKSAQGEPRLAFEFLEGPVTPRPEKIPRPPSPSPPAAKTKRKPSARRSKPSGPKGGGHGGDNTPPPRGSVPKVPLGKA